MSFVKSLHSPFHTLLSFLLPCWTSVNPWQMLLAGKRLTGVWALFELHHFSSALVCLSLENVQAWLTLTSRRC